MDSNLNLQILIRIMEDINYGLLIGFILFFGLLVLKKVGGKRLQNIIN